MVTPSLVSKVIFPKEGTRKSTKARAQNASSQRRDRGGPGGGAPGAAAGVPPASGEPGELDTSVWVMATAAG
ncbi:hypothetical protein SRIMM317S_06272 [Streptomyces rimosus subsp. rimosus]